MEATRRQRESMRDPVADIRTTSENVVAQQVETSSEQWKPEADQAR